jgi:hypothetical protein
MALHRKPNFICRRCNILWRKLAFVILSHECRLDRWLQILQEVDT